MSGFTLGPDSLAATPTAGQVEYNGTGLFYTPSGTQRGIIPGQQYYRLNSDLAGQNVTSAQNIFGVGVTLASSTVYAFEMFFPMSKTAGATSHNVLIGFGGNATLNNIGYYQYNHGDTAAFTTAPLAGTILDSFIQTATATIIVPSLASATQYRVHSAKGTVSVNAGGTFIPQYTLSVAPGGAYTTAAGSYMLIYPIGTAGSNINVGTWA